MKREKNKIERIIINLSDLKKYLDKDFSNLPCHVFETLGESINDLKRIMEKNSNFSVKLTEEIEAFNNFEKQLKNKYPEIFNNEDNNESN